MKLLSKTSLMIITASIFIFWLGNIIFFFVTREMINRQINSDLMTRMSEVMTALDNKKADIGSLSVFEEITINDYQGVAPMPPSFSDTVLYNNAQQKYIAHRALSFTYLSPDSTKEIHIYKSLLSSDQLIERITLLSVLLLISFIAIIFVLNRFIFTNVWSGFSKSLERLDKYSFTDLDNLKLPESEIEEFDRLNQVLLEMASRIQNDYRNLKELTANTSHEIQTPLAIIKNKSELLMQSEKLGQEEMEALDSILNTVSRLSKLNQSLLLITRIENMQYEESETIDLDHAIEKSLDHLEIFLNAGEIEIDKDIPELSVDFNPVLLDILLSNLIKNAIQHGRNRSRITIKTDGKSLLISNTGDPLPFPREHLFTRFIKGSSAKGGTGIGLELVRKICNYYKLNIIYSYSEDLHTFKIDFTPRATKV